jgi:hypothetical protein
MENTKVVVMSANDVAAMRKAHKEAEKAYFEAKVGALEFVAQEMRRTGEEYTAAELAHMSGLTSGEIAAQLGCFYTHASQKAGIGTHDVRTDVRHLENRYVRILPNGEIDPNNILTVVRKQVVYKMPSNEPKRR